MENNLFFNLSIVLFYIVQYEDYSSLLSKAMTRKIFMLLHSQYMCAENRLNGLKMACEFAKWLFFELISNNETVEQSRANS